MYFDVIIPTYNNCAELQQCLQGLSMQTHKHFRAIVCIDGSTDGTLQWLESTTHTFPLIIAQHSDGKNHGRNPTRNLALPNIQSEYIAFLDSDLIPHPEFLAQHAQLLAERNCISVGDVQYTNANTNRWAAYLQTRGKNKFPHGSIIPYYYLITQNTAHKSTYFIQCGGQDSRVTQYGGGDTAYALQLHAFVDIPTIFNKKALATGDMNKTLGEALNQLEKFGATNLVYLHQQYPNELSMFRLHTLLGRSTSDKLLRMLLIRPLANLVQRFATVLPLQAINYAVLCRIYLGWKSVH